MSDDQKPAREFWIDTIAHEDGRATHDIQIEYLEGTDYTHVIEYSAWLFENQKRNEAVELCSKMEQELERAEAERDKYVRFIQSKKKLIETLKGKAQWSLTIQDKVFDVVAMRKELDEWREQAEKLAEAISSYNREDPIELEFALKQFEAFKEKSKT